MHFQHYQVKREEFWMHRGQWFVQELQARIKTSTHTPLCVDPCERCTDTLPVLFLGSLCVCVLTVGMAVVEGRCPRFSHVFRAVLIVIRIRENCFISIDFTSTAVVPSVFLGQTTHTTGVVFKFWKATCVLILCRAADQSCGLCR